MRKQLISSHFRYIEKSARRGSKRAVPRKWLKIRVVGLLLPICYHVFTVKLSESNPKGEGNAVVSCKGEACYQT